MDSAINRLARFSLIGVVVTIFYFAAASALNLAGATTTSASIWAYLLATTVSYFTHRSFTFRSRARHHSAMPRFLIVSAIGLAIAAILPAPVEVYFNTGPIIGYAAVTVAVAAWSFAAMSFAVFRPAREHQED